MYIYICAYIHINHCNCYSNRIIHISTHAFQCIYIIYIYMCVYIYIYVDYIYIYICIYIYIYVFKGPLMGVYKPVLRGPAQTNNIIL